MFPFKIKPPKRLSIFAVSFEVVAAINITPSFAVTDPVVLTFSTVGDSRQDPENPDSTVKQTEFPTTGCPVPSGTGLTATNPGLSGQDCKWLQNTKAWSRIMRAIQSQKANLLFFNGDMIMGYGNADVPVTRLASTDATASTEIAIPAPSVTQIVRSDLMQFYQQYGFWRGMVANLMETGTYVVPVPGNHEVQCKRCGKKATVVNENAWVDNMGDLILDQARFNALLTTPTYTQTTANTNLSTTAPGAADGVTSTADQKKLTYSFDVGTSHFIVIDTDLKGNDGKVPTNWLSQDLSDAKFRGATNFFVFGHKPAFYHSYGNNPPSSSAPYLSNAATFWNLLIDYKATYFCGHEHIFDVSRYPGTGANSSKSAYQVLVGAGGSPFDALSTTPGIIPTDRMYSWATVRIFQSGKVMMDTYGFDTTIANPIAKLQDSIQLN